MVSILANAQKLKTKRISLDGGRSLIALVVSLFHILSPINKYLALLALGWRIGEVVISTVSKLDDFLVLTLSQQVASSDKAIEGLDYLGRILISGSSQGLLIAMVFFSIGSIFNNVLFYKSKAIPVSLAVFGLIGTGLITISAVLSLVVDLPRTVVDGAAVPIIVFEYVLGFYLIFRGMEKRSA